jgi:hypothetical protein
MDNEESEGFGNGCYGSYPGRINEFLKSTFEFNKDPNFVPLLNFSNFFFFIIFNQYFYIKY